VRKSASLLALPAVVWLALLSTAQVNPGVPSFSAYDSHEIDTIDLLNNNIVLHLPVVSKSGAFPLDFSLVGNSFMSTNASGWIASLTYTWPIAGAANGILSRVNNSSAESTKTVSATCPGGGSTTKFMNWVVTFADGTVHPLPTTDYTDSYGSGLSCLNASFTDTTIDNSGLTVSVTRNIVNSIYNNSGALLTLGTISTESIKDSNGNTMSMGSSGTAVVDTLGLTVVTDAGFWPDETFTWNDVAGGTPQVAESSTSLPILTNFGCGTPADTGGGSKNMLTSVSYPDGTSVALTYEGTPSHLGNYTGRIGSITLRELGTISYGYHGGSEGINCTYQVAPELQRVTSDGTTTYTLAYSLIAAPIIKRPIPL
jgi:hypothetical protein